MNVENIAKQAVDIIKNKWGLPEKGLLAGGSLANTILYLIDKKPYPINDIDIFILDDSNKNDNLFSFKKEETTFYEDYHGIGVNNKVKESYQIIESKNNNIFNNIFYKSTTTNPDIVIDSFDLSCVKVGYVIEEDRYIIDKSFVKFLEKRYIEVCNLNTPYHTAIRLAKKIKDLDILKKDHDFEFKLLQHSIYYDLKGILRTGFKEKYKNDYESNKDILERYFILVEDLEKKARILEKYGKNDNIYTLQLNEEFLISDDDVFKVRKKKIFSDDNLTNINSNKKFLLYMRNFSYSEIYRNIWENLFFVRHNDTHLNTEDIDLSEDDINLLKNVGYRCPNSNNLFKDFTLKQRLEQIRYTIDTFKDDPVLATTVMDNMVLGNKIDDFEKILIEISLRKKALNYTSRTLDIFEKKQHNESVEIPF